MPIHRMLVLGHGGAGKDEFCKVAEDVLSLHYEGPTSKIIVQEMYNKYLEGNLSEKIVNKVRNVPPGQPLTYELIYENRRNIRSELLELGSELLRENGLGYFYHKQCIEKGADVMAGIRRHEELVEVVNRFTHIFWIHRPELERDPTMEFSIEDVLDAFISPEKVHIVINDTPLYKFVYEAASFLLAINQADRSEEE